ncbi:MAG TPA: fatty acid--CoA ligase family protein, partial [Phenylobacterium sp.]
QAMTLAAWSQGATLIADYTAEQLAESLEALRPSIVGLTPVFLRRLLAALPQGLGVQPGLRVVSTGGVLPPDVARDARLRLSSEILISYGAAETGSATMADGAWLDEHRGAAGYAVPGVRVEVVDGDGAPVAPGETGEVRIFSDRVSDGYLGDPEATAQAFRDGAFYPGDVGRLLADGLLMVDGRVDDRMDLGGMKFLPDPLEDLVMALPGVIDAAAYAVPDAQGINGCWVAVAAVDGFDRQRLADHIARHGQDLPPVRFAWIDAIPRNAMGKVERRRLREETIAALGIAEGARAPDGAAGHNG